ncbi:MAG: ribbon-helix-helix domain-containing protein [Chloroflexi bacterium]|nr:ribbon-helix-helix domain-containing protein [Chloroflexota bacterium]
MTTQTKRTTIYFDPGLYKALRTKSAETECSISDLVNEAVRLSLAEDAADIAALSERAGEPDLSFDDVLRDWRQRGKI